MIVGDIHHSCSALYNNHSLAKSLHCAVHTPSACMPHKPEMQANEDAAGLTSRIPHNGRVENVRSLCSHQAAAAEHGKVTSVAHVNLNTEIFPLKLKVFCHPA